MNNKITKAFEIFLYIEAMIVFALSFVGGFIIETYLGTKIYGEIYMTRLVDMMHNPACIAATAISFGFLAVVLIRNVAKPVVNDILANIENS